MKAVFLVENQDSCPLPRYIRQQTQIRRCTNVYCANTLSRIKKKVGLRKKKEKFFSFSVFSVLKKIIFFFYFETKSK
jgi:hypothetical protein